MKPAGSLKRRILLASFTMAFVICLLFSIGFFWALEYAEMILFDDRVDADISTFIYQYEVEPKVALLPRETFEVFIAPGGDESQLPTYLRNLSEDADEVVLDGRELHLEIEEEGDTTFYFLFDETRYEAFDQLLGVFVPVIIGVICLIAFGLGFALSNRITRPVSELAARVNRSESPDGATPEGAHKGGDEIEILAHAIDSYQSRVGELLAREREFSSDASHELRTPLMGIQAAADNLLVSAGNQERTEELASRIQKRCAQMRALVDALLALARDPHSLENDFRGLKLSDVVRDQVEAAAPHVESRGVNIQIIEKGNPEVFTSDAVMNVVIGNILRNAIIHSHSKEIHIQVNSSSLSIQDFGQGVADELKGRIFERYSSSGTDPARDFGIGLDLVRRICSHFRWLLSLDSTPGRGTTISIDFRSSIRP